MIEFFTKIGDLISIVIDYVVMVIKNLFMLLVMVPKAFSALVQTLVLFPPFITVPLMAFLGIALAIAILSSFKG